MSSAEFVVSENEWQQYLPARDVAKRLFNVDIRRQGGMDTNYCYYGRPMDFTKKQLACIDNDPSSSCVATTQNKKDNVAPLEENVAVAESDLEGDSILRPPPVITLFETTSSSENLEKCKKFMCAFTPTDPNYRVVTLQVKNLRSLEMVRDSSSDLQQSTAALISFQPEQLGVTIQGHYSCVEMAKEKISMILQHDHLNSSFLEKDDHIQHSKSNSSTLPAGAIKQDKNVHSHSNVWPDQEAANIKSGPKPGPDESDILEDFRSEKVYKDNRFTDSYNFSSLLNVLSEERADVSQTSSNQCHREPCENSYEFLAEPSDVWTDGRFREHIDLASKCGFSDHQINNVLKRLGVDCSMQDMMHELVKEPQEDSESELYSRQPEGSASVLTSSEDQNDSGEDFDVNDSSNLKPIIIDGSNVAMSHGQKVFSCKGIKIVVDWFKRRGHDNITVFVPQWRKEASRPDAPISDQEILTELEEERIVVFTPSRRVGGTRIVCYDDRYVLQLAVQNEGIVVSNDVYRDLVRERDDFKEVVEKRLLQYSFVKDIFMPPEDPLGKQGPSLDNYLRIKPAEPKHRPPNCPYGKKCTYGFKCKYYHPERRSAPPKMVAEKLKENAELKQKANMAAKSGEASGKGMRPKPKLSRTVSMLPQEMADTPCSDLTADEKVKKPPLLQHSKSLQFPNSYLTELRLKMEEAESKETSHDIFPPSTTTSHASGTQLPTAKDVDNHHSKSGNTSLRTSPAPSTDDGKSKVSSSSSFPLGHGPSVSPVPAPVEASVAASSLEPQGRYLSGHLLVAKKLSDEENNNSGNFFSSHTSRVPGSMTDTNMSPYDDRLISQESSRSPVNVKPPSSQYAQDTFLDSQEIYLPPEIANQPTRIQKGQDSKSISPVNMPGLPGEDSPFSSLSMNSPGSKGFVSCPPFSQKDASFQCTPNQHFQRSISSTAPSKGPEYQNPRYMDRKHSLNSPYTQTGDNPDAQMKPGAHWPPAGRSLYSQPAVNPSGPPQPHYQRKKSSFDSGISSGEQPTFLFSPTEDLSSPFQSAPKPANPSYVSPTQNPAVQHMMQQQQQRGMYPPSPYPLGQQASVATSSHPGYGYHPPSSPWQWQQSPLPHRVSFESPYPFQPVGTVHNASSSAVTPTHSPLYTSQNFGMPFPPTSHMQSVCPPSYANPDSPFYPMAAQGMENIQEFVYNTSAPSSPFAQAPPPIPKPKVDDEAPISVNDPRYSIYYNLSSVFGERVVRTFMNRNPDVSGSNIKELYSLISKYKQDTGM